jgi:hypothetical protein
MKDVNDFLEHYGVKGMKWGVRKDRQGIIRPRVTLNYFDRREQRWVDSAQTKRYSEVYRRAQFGIRKGIRELNENPKYKGQSFKLDSPLRKEYYSDYSKLVTDQLNSTVGKQKILNPFGKVGQSPFRRFELNFEFDVEKELRPRAFIRRTDTSAARKQKIGHADMEEDFEIEVGLVFDELDHIIDIRYPGVDEPVEHSTTDDMDEFLEHWGILGMKWGVRRPTGPDGLVAGSPYRKQKVSIGDLSDEELKKVITRIEMEKKYSDLTKNNSKLKIGAAIVGGVLVTSGKKVAEEYLTKWLRETAEKAAKKGR